VHSASRLGEQDEQTCGSYGVWEYSSGRACFYRWSTRLKPSYRREDNGDTDERQWCAILLMSAAISSVVSKPLNAEGVAQWESDGRSFFFACEFKQATRAFEKALAEQPDSAILHYWLGKSYARLAEVSSPLSAPKNARKARVNLERSVQLDPQNDEYLLELFDFYVDSPEWFTGGLQRAAALLERFSPRESAAVEAHLQQLANSRKEYSGAGWWMRRAVLWLSGAIGRLVP
jgi:tetratricopeptide (TPR) repeat protein